MCRLPRFIDKKGMLMLSGFAFAMMLAVIFLLCDTSFEFTPLYGIIISCGFLLVWFCAAGYMVLCGLAALQTVEIDQDEIRICVGRWVLCRIRTDCVKTVGIGAAPGKIKRYGLYHGTVYLALSKYSVDELNRKGRKYLRSLGTAKAMDFAPVTLDGSNAAAKAYLLNRFSNGLLWVEWSQEMETALRQNLLTSVFLL